MCYACCPQLGCMWEAKGKNRGGMWLFRIDLARQDGEGTSVPHSSPWVLGPSIRHDWKEVDIKPCSSLPSSRPEHLVDVALAKLKRTKRPLGLERNGDVQDCRQLEAWVGNNSSDHRGQIMKKSTGHQGGHCDASFGVGEGRLWYKCKHAYCPGAYASVLVARCIRVVDHWQSLQHSPLIDTVSVRVSVEKNSARLLIGSTRTDYGCKGSSCAGQDGPLQALLQHEEEMVPILNKS